MKRSLTLFVMIAVLSGCASHPQVAPTPSELKARFYSLYQSNLSGYQCEVHSEMLHNMSEFEFNLLFKELFKRESTLQERGFLKKLKWTVRNSNESQQVTPLPLLKEFPTEESRNVAERVTNLLVIANKILTLTYIETFADRPDLRLVHIGEKYFQVIGNDDSVVAELEFNQKKYRIFFGGKQNQVEVTLSKLGSMQIPEQIEVRNTDQKGVIFPKFEIRQGYPQLDRVDLKIPELGNTLLKFPFQLCEYHKL